MDTFNACPACGGTSPKYDTRSDWCRDCTLKALAEQQKRRYAPQRRQTIDPHAGGTYYDNDQDFLDSL